MFKKATFLAMVLLAGGLAAAAPAYGAPRTGFEILCKLRTDVQSLPMPEGSWINFFARDCENHGLADPLALDKFHRQFAHPAFDTRYLGWIGYTPAWYPVDDDTVISQTVPECGSGRHNHFAKRGRDGRVYWEKVILRREAVAVESFGAFHCSFGVQRGSRQGYLAGEGPRESFDALVRVPVWLTIGLTDGTAMGVLIDGDDALRDKDPPPEPLIRFGHDLEAPALARDPRYLVLDAAELEPVYQAVDRLQPRGETISARYRQKEELLHKLTQDFLARRAPPPAPR